LLATKTDRSHCRRTGGLCESDRKRDISW